MHRLSGLVVGFTLVSLIVYPTTTSAFISALASFYVFLGIIDAVKRWYHMRRVSTRSDTGTMQYISRLITLGYYGLGHFLYHTCVTDAPTRTESRATLHTKVFAALGLALVSGGIANGGTLLTAPLLQNSLVAVGIAVGGGLLVSGGHIVWFQFRASRHSPTATHVIEQNLDTIYDDR